MDLTLGLFLLIAFILLLTFGFPIAIAIGGASAIVMLYAMPYKVVAITVGQKMATGIDSFSLLAIPFFVLAGNIMNQGGIARRLVQFAYLFVGKIPGSLSHVNVLSNMMFGSVSGSAVAAAAAVGKTMLPQIKRAGINLPVASAINIASCPTGMLIPPSNGLIVYSVVSGGTSIGALFLAGYVPGILMGLVCMVIGYFYFKLKPDLQTNHEYQHFTFKEVLLISWQALPSLGLIIVVIGSIVAGVCTATEAACMAVLYSLVLSLIYKQINKEILITIFKDTVEISAIVLFLIGASTIMSYIMAYAHIPKIVSEAMLSISDNKIIILLIINVILLIVGMFMDMTPAILIFTPIFLPIVTSLGIDPVHFGIIMTFNLCIGIVTPPVGTALFVGCSVSGLKIEQVIKPLIPIIIAEILVLLVISYIPALSLYIPEVAGFMQN